MNHRRFILIAIENFLNAELHPAAIHETLTLKPQSYWEQVFEAECTAAVRVLKELRYQIPAADCTRHKQLVYVDASGILGLLKMFEKTQYDADGGTSAPHSLYTAVIPFLEMVVRYIESTGGDCMEPGTLVPGHHLDLRREEIRQQHLVLRAKMKSREIDPALQHIINHHLEGFQNDTFTRYQQLQYNRSLMDGLSELMSSNKTGNWTTRMINKLVTLNFNQTAFYEYCSGSIAAALEQEQSAERKCSRLRWYVKELKCLMPAPLMALEPDTLSLRKLLLAYLSAELNYHEAKLPAAESAALPGEAAATAMRDGTVRLAGTGKIEKLQLNASMRTLCVGIQYLVLINFFQVEKGGIKRILQFFADHFSTIGTETLSVQSMQKRFSEKNDAAILAVIHVLEKMVSALKAGLGS
jgi:hypothetical protein